jgi:ABC-type nickel/cobalt efflux system permease component RcnA
MSPTLPAVAAISLALGVRHAFEPDHLAAVSTLATRQGRSFQAAWLGLAWGLGHTASIAAVALIVIVGGLTLPARLWPAADVLVGLLLVALGTAVLWRYAGGRWHMHRHAHDGGAGGAGGAPHLHLHSHAHGAAHEHTHARWDWRRALGFGLLHGLAGSGAIIILLVTTVPTQALKLAYVAAFGLGTIVGMLAVSVVLVAVVRYAASWGERWAAALHLAAAAASVGIGCLLVVTTFSSLR